MNFAHVQQKNDGNDINRIKNHGKYSKPCGNIREIRAIRGDTRPRRHLRAPQRRR